MQTSFNPENTPLPVTDILARVDSGVFDNASPSEVLQLLVDWCKSQTDVTDITDITDLRFFRAVVTQLWIINQGEKNGSPEFKQDGMPCSLPLTSGTVRGVLVAGLEMAITERYGSERAEAEILRFYRLMQETDSVSGALTLSPFGVEVLTDICLSILLDALSAGDTTGVTQ